MNLRTALTTVALAGALALAGCSQAATTATPSMDKSMAPAATSPAMDKSPTMDKMTPSPSMTKESMMGAGAYVTLADYEKSMSMYKDSKVVYFFHASWCPDCKAADMALTASPSPIPKGVTVVKVDYDTATALKQKYGVTMQTTFVQVDDMGKAVMKWTGKPVDVVLGEVKA